MSVSVNFYTTADDPRKLNKTLTAVSTASCDLTEPTNIENPSMLVGSPISLKGVNYMYIADFHRYYYCSVDIISGGLCRVTATECDVLMSFKAGINATKILLDRTSEANLRSLYFADDRIRKYSYERTQAKYFPNDVLDQDGYCVLITTGGAPASP